MQRSRRAVLAAVPAVALAGCGRSLRQNTVPGGLDIRNGRSESVTVAVRAAVLPPLETESGGIGGNDPTDTPATPRDADLESPDATGEYAVDAGGNRRVPDFFPRAGRWGVEVVLNPDSDAAADRTRIELHASLPGPTGADTLVVEVTNGGLRAEATTVD